MDTVKVIRDAVFDPDIKLILCESAEESKMFIDATSDLKWKHERRAHPRIIYRVFKLRGSEDIGTYSHNEYFRDGAFDIPEILVKSSDTYNTLIYEHQIVKLSDLFTPEPISKEDFLSIFD